MLATYYPLFLLIAAIAFIVWSTACKKINPFFVLLAAALFVGVLSGLPLSEMVNALKLGFGHTMEKIGLLIIHGTTLGVILEKTGATLSMATTILQRVKEKNAPLAISITGFIVGIPIFCDSGFIILSGLNHSLVKKTNQPMPVMAAALASSLYAVHCLVPPHPGITAATGSMGGDLGTIILWGILLAIPAAFVGYIYGAWRGKKITEAYEEQEDVQTTLLQLPPAWLSFVPIIFPIVLIAFKSMVMLYTSAAEIAASSGLQMLSFAGDPVIALLLAILLSVTLIGKQGNAEWKHWLSDGVHKSGMILGIIAAGGMFGEMLQATGIGKHIGAMLGGLSIGIFVPFLFAAILKTAQGSSTIAVITAASLVAPMLPVLGLHTPTGSTLAILSLGAGSMVVSHANDANFWVISRFSNLSTASTLKVYSSATALMGLTVQLLIWIAWMLMNNEWH
jgi:GntP family gluconate:H+ symporter